MMKLEFIAKVNEVGDAAGGTTGIVIDSRELASLLVVRLGMSCNGCDHFAAEAQAKAWARHLYGKVRITIEAISDEEDR